MIKKYIFLAVAGLLACTATFSQNYAKQELSLWGAGGLSTLKYDAVIGDKKNGIGGAFGVGYNYFFTEQWSIGSGIELAFYNSKTEMNNFSDVYNSNDGEYQFEFRTDVDQYIEKQNTLLVNIPVMVQFQLPVLGNNQFYAAAGGKIGIPVSKKFKVTDASFSNTAYYAQWDSSVEELEFMGFGDFTRKDVKGNTDLKVAYMLSLETGMKWKLPNTLALYTGAYFDYGLNDISKTNDKRLIEYNMKNPEDFIHNSVLSSKYTVDGKTVSFTDKVRPMAVGIKVRLAFGL